MQLTIKDDRNISKELVLDLYRTLGWSAAGKPQQLYAALLNSHTLLTAWDGERLIGLGNAISDGHLVVYFPHLLVHPDYQGKGVGKAIMAAMERRYRGFHMQMLTADADAVAFYERIGFERAGDTIPMWRYAGKEHG